MAQLPHRWKEKAHDMTSKMSQVKVLAEPKLEIMVIRGKRKEDQLCSGCFCTGSDQICRSKGNTAHPITYAKQ